MKRERLEEEPVRTKPEPTPAPFAPPLPSLEGHLLTLQRQVGNAAIARVLGEPAGSLAVALMQRSPSGVTAAPPPGLAAAPEPKDFPSWTDPASQEVLPGEPAPGYEVPHDLAPLTAADKLELYKALWKRERENKKNASHFVGEYGEALVELWGEHVSEAMAKAAEEAGWSLFGKILKFVVIKSLEIMAGTLLTPGAVAAFEAFEVKVAEKIVEKGIEAITAAGGEVGAELLEEGKKESDIEVKKHDLDRATKFFAHSLKELTVETIGGLPDVTPYARWLEEASDSQLVKFRIPYPFPEVSKGVIRATVAGLIASQLQEHAGGWRHGPDGPDDVNHYDDNIILVALHPRPRGADHTRASIYSTSEDLTRAMSDHAPIRALPTVALRIEVDAEQNGDSTAASRLMAAYRSPGAAMDDEVAQFGKAYPQRDYMYITRSPHGEIKVLGGGVSEHLWLYEWATGDASLSQLSSDVLRAAEGKEDYARELRALKGLPSEDDEVSSLQSPAHLADATQELFDEDTKKKGAELLIHEHIDDIVPTPPTYDRWHPEDWKTFNWHGRAASVAPF
jgi:hypothetical protein